MTRNFRTADLATLHEWEVEYREEKARQEARVIELTTELSKATLKRNNARFLADKVRWWIGQHDDDDLIERVEREMDTGSNGEPYRT